MYFSNIGPQDLNISCWLDSFGLHQLTLKAVEYMTSKGKDSLCSQGYFLIRIVWGGVQLGPLSTSATNWPIVPAPGDYDDGEFRG
jgi:hypothetical protein